MAPPPHDFDAARDAALGSLRAIGYAGVHFAQISCLKAAGQSLRDYLNDIGQTMGALADVQARLWHALPQEVIDTIENALARAGQLMPIETPSGTCLTYHQATLDWTWWLVSIVVVNAPPDVPAFELVMSGDRNGIGDRMKRFFRGLGGDGLEEWLSGLVEELRTAPCPDATEYTAGIRREWAVVVGAEIPADNGQSGGQKKKIPVPKDRKVLELVRAVEKCKDCTQIKEIALEITGGNVGEAERLMRARRRHRTGK